MRLGTTKKFVFLIKKKMAYGKRKRSRSLRGRRPVRRRMSRKKRMGSRKKYYPLYRYRRPDKYTVKLQIDQEFTEGFQLATIASPQSLCFSPALNWCINFQEYQQLFERARINCVTFHYQVARAEVMNVDVITTGGISSPAMNIPQLLTRLDYNTNQADTFIDDATLLEKFGEYSNTRRQMCNRPFSQKITPCALQPMYAGLDSSANPLWAFHTTPPKPWIEMNNTPSVKMPMYPALHVGLTSQAAVANSQTFLLRPVIHMYVTFAGKRQ